MLLYLSDDANPLLALRYNCDERDLVVEIGGCDHRGTCFFFRLIMPHLHTIIQTGDVERYPLRHPTLRIDRACVQTVRYVSCGTVVDEDPSMHCDEHPSMHCASCENRPSPARCCFRPHDYRITLSTIQLIGKNARGAHRHAHAQVR